MVDKLIQNETEIFSELLHSSSQYNLSQVDQLITQKGRSSF